MVTRRVSKEGSSLTRFEVALFLVFRTKGPAICLAQSVGLGVRRNRLQGPKVRQLGLVACKRPGLQPLQFIGFISPALRAGLGKLVGRCPEKRNSATSKLTRRVTKNSWKNASQRRLRECEPPASKRDVPFHLHILLAKRT